MSLTSTPPPLRRHELVAGQSNFLQAKRARCSYGQRGPRRKYKQHLDEDRRINNNPKNRVVFS